MNEQINERMSKFTSDEVIMKNLLKEINYLVYSQVMIQYKNKEGV